MSSIAAQSYSTILVSRPDPAVTLVTFNRPKVLNALSTELGNELLAALKEADADDSVSAIVLTGSDSVFAGTLYCS
jgi:enoyl-CoA hydratase